MKKVRLKEICDLQNGYAFKSTDYIEKSNTLNCRMSNIRPGAVFDIEYSPKYLPDEFVKKYEEFILKDGDIVIAMTDLAGDPKILGVPAEVDTKGKNVLLNQRVGKLIIKNKDKIYYSYLKYVLSNPANKEYYKKFAGGGLQLNISKKDILNLEIPIYEINKQMEISNKLNKIQEIINIRKKQIEQLDELIKSQFVEMFKSEKNIEKLENVCQFINGDRGKNYPSASEFVDKGIPFINAGLIKEKKVDWNNMNYITENKYNKLGSGKIQKDDILYCLRGSLGKHCIIDTDKRGAIASSLVILRPKREKIEPIFLLIQLGMDEIIKQQNQANNGSSQPNLSASSVKKYKIKLPDMVLQTKFVNIVKQINKQEFEIQKSIEETQNLQKSLMDKCFGG